jgi:hypothetical protein
MELTRFYKKKQVSSADVRAIRNLLEDKFSWALHNASYYLCYPSECVSVAKLNEVDEVVKTKGQPQDFYVAFATQHGSKFNLETRRESRIEIRVEPAVDSPYDLLNAIEAALSLQLISQTSKDRVLASAFIAHSFQEDGSSYANELARFLGLLRIHSQSGRGFAPMKVSEKVTARLARHDLFFGIITPEEDYTWITQEMAAAASLKKDVFILKQEDVKLKEGILGDHEYIAFPKGQFSKTFIPILEGLNELRGIESGICHPQKDPIEPPRP